MRSLLSTAPHITPYSPHCSFVPFFCFCHCLYCTFSFLIFLCRGVTAVHFRDYALGCLGMIPGTVAYVFIGTTASSLLGDDSEEESDDDSSSSNVQLIVIIVGAIATIIAVVLISIYAKRALNKVLEEDMEAEERMANDAAGMESGGATSVPSDDAQDQGAARPAALDYPVRTHA